MLAPCMDWATVSSSSSDALHQDSARPRVPRFARIDARIVRWAALRLASGHLARSLASEPNATNVSNTFVRGSGASCFQPLCHGM